MKFLSILINNVHLRQTLIHICWNLNYVYVAKTIIERIIDGVGKHNDAIDEYLDKDKVQDSSSKITVLQEYLNRTDCFGVRAIHLASHNGNIKMIKLLWANECDPFLNSDDGLSWIHSAAEGDSVNVSIILLVYFWAN